ncbi:MAG: thiamine pyrophosphate-dependent enzyme [Candidatus Methylacidiphilales bacterium]|nr:thiamine pyrophosphate-dependent enzyme [Candidatus Methylacidiphilales bacterium]
MAKLAPDTKLRLLELMLLSREGDRREGILARQGKGWFQISSLGHEALAAITPLLQKQDFLFPHYRDRGLVMARGVNSRELARAFFAKRTSSSGGRQLPGHFSSRKHGIWSLPSPTGSPLLPACGFAWGAKLDGQDALVLACVGDSGMRQGEFYEAVSFALQQQLPMVFVVEDNGFGISTRTTHTNPLRLGLFDKENIIQADGRTVDSVHEAAERAVQRVRSGRTPVILWLELDRQGSHSSSDDHRLYRPSDELKEMAAREPVETLAAELIDQGHLSPTAWEEMKTRVQNEVEAAYREAEAEADPKPENTLEELTAEFTPAPRSIVPGTEETRMLDAVNRVFREALKRDPGVLFFGEDIEDPMGGVFKLTHGLSTDFPGRIHNSPLAEATILGVGCGLASYGKHPVFELQFIDFVGPGWNQLVNNIATLRWRTFGEWTCPMVIYAPYGAYLPGGGPWHSQSNEAAFAHIPGIRVVVPSRPEDAAGLMMSAIDCPDPVLVLLPKHMIRMRQPATAAWSPIPFGQAAVRRQGLDVTVVAWGNCTEKVEEALAVVGDRVSVEFIDLRSIVPWDRETLAQSVRKTGRLLVVEEDNRTCSFGQTLVSELLQDPEVWDSLVQHPVLISRDDIHVGFHPVYEETCLPSTSEIVRAILGLIGMDGSGSSPVVSPNGHGHHGVAVAVGARTVPIRVPAIGEGLEEARILKFFKKPGENVARDELIYQLETDKAVVDIESSHSGILQSWDAAEESNVRIGAVIGQIEPVSESQIPALTPKPHTPETVMPTPPLPSPDADLAYEEISVSPQQQILSNRLTRAARVAVPATIFQEVTWEPVERARKHFKASASTEEITTFSLVSWCVKEALVRHPQFRSSLPQNNVLRIYKNVNLGIAVSLPGDDLTTAVVEKAETFGLREFAHLLRERVDLARQGRDQARQQVSLIITSMASFDIPDGIPVIVPPAVATLLVNAPIEKVIFQNGQPLPRKIVNLALTIDHRVINGAGAAKFLNEVKHQIESFDSASVRL